MAYYRVECPACSGTGRTLDIFNWRNWRPFCWDIRPFRDCTRCRGKGWLWKKVERNLYR